MLSNDTRLVYSSFMAVAYKNIILHKAEFLNVSKNAKLAFYSFSRAINDVLEMYF